MWVEPRPLQTYYNNWLGCIIALMMTAAWQSKLLADNIQLLLLVGVS